ncbi:MAG: hypothetical protein AAB564_01310, partial [Patescibacteria group bacterium]
MSQKTNSNDPWDQALFNKNNLSKKKTFWFADFLKIKISISKIFVVLSIIIGSFVFLFKNHDLVLAKSSSLKI